MIKTILISLLFVLNETLFAQENTFDSLPLLERFSELRTAFLSDSTSLLAYGVIAIEDAKVNWDSLYKHPFKIDYNYAEYDLIHDVKNFNRIVLTKTYGENSILTKLNIAVEEVKKENRFVISSIQYGILDSFYPFKLKLKSELFSELSFYNINSFDTLLDYDLGYLCFAPIICTVYPSTHFNLAVFLTSNQKITEQELNDFLITDIHKNNIKIKSSRSKNLKGVKSHYHKIFIQYPIEYYKKPTTVFKNAKKYLKKDGFIFIYQYKDPLFKGIYRPNFFTQLKINKLLTKSGLKLIDTLDLPTKTIYKCTLIDDF